MSTGLEMMAAKMLGLTPDALSQTVEGFKNMVEDFSSRLARIEAKEAANTETLALILAHLKGNENGGHGNGSHSGDGGNAAG